MSVMLDEIKQDGKSILRTVESVRKSAGEAADALLGSDYVIITGSGTSYHAGLSLQISLLKEDVPAVLVKAPDFENYIPGKPEKKVAVVVMSQSGESADALNALNLSAVCGARVIGITNEENSSLAHEADISVLTSAGSETAIAATKSYVAQLTAVALIQGHLHGMDPMSYVTEIASWADNATSHTGEYEHLSRALKSRIVFLGNGYMFGTALEGALKFRETGNLLTEAYQIREYLHGPIQTLDADTSVMILRDAYDGYSPVISEMKKYTSSIITMGSAEPDTVKLPYDPGMFAPIRYSIPIQLLAYYKANSMGLNPDKPEKLTKVVK